MWADLSLTELYSILKLRTDVFFIEQKIDEEELDWRDAEPTTEHWWIADESGTASYLRTIVDAEPEHLDAVRLIGRVVTDPASRGQGLSSVLLKAVIDAYLGSHQDVDLGVITGRYDGELNEEAKELLAEIQEAEEASIAEAQEEKK